MQKQTMPSSDTSAVISFGLGVVFIVFVLLGGWMAYAPLDSSSVAVGKISADLNKKTIQHLEGGIVEAIYVKDGDIVKKGDLLIKLEDVQTKAQLNIFKSQYQDIIARQARLKAQRDDLDKVIFPKDLTDSEAKRDQRNIFETTKKSMQDEKIITQNRIVQIQNQIEGLNSLIKSKEIRSKSIQEEIAEWEELYKQRLVDKQRIRELKREDNNIAGELASTKSEMAKLNEQISESQNQQLLREKEFKKEVLNMFAESQAQLSDVKSRIIAIQDTLQRTKIISPIDGTIVGLDIHTVGGVITPGKPILEIVPSDSKLLVIAQVNITDIDRVKVGLLADINFSAFDMRQVNVIEGKVIHVSADSFIDEVTGAPYYEAKIEVTKKGLQQLKDDNFILVSGMPAEVMIKLGSRTPLSYLVQPFTDMLTKGFNEE